MEPAGSRPTPFTARKAGATGTLVLRADSAYYGHDVITAVPRQQARFSVTARQDKAVRKAISAIDDQAWTTIKYTNAIFDEQQQRWISDAAIAEVPYTGFTFPTQGPAHPRPANRAAGRRHHPNNQSELFTAHRYPAVFTNSPLADDRGGEGAPRARDRRAGHRRPEERATGAPAVRHFWANSAWLVCAIFAFDLTRTAGTMARPSTPRPPPARSGRSSSPSRGGSPAPLDGSPCTCRPAGPGRCREATGDRSEQSTARSLTHPPAPQDLLNNIVETSRPVRPPLVRPHTTSEKVTASS